MIIDAQTNIVYFSSLLEGHHPKFWIELETILEKHSIKWKWINNTRDIWCRDYMPVQITEDEYVQFKFFPNYYLDHNYIRYLTIQDEMDYIQMGNINYVDLIVDGGNIVKTKDKAIMTEKVFKANDNRDKQVVIRTLKKGLKVNNIYFIPVQPEDITGHSDGMVRFFDENTILVNDFDESPSWMERFNRSIRKTGLNVIQFPYQPSKERKDGEFTAHGCYINFAQIGKLIIFPQFGKEFSRTDKIALQRMEKLYPAPNYIIETINADSSAWHGGVLNCCTWNISRPIIENAIDKILPIYKNNDLVLVIHVDDFKGKPIDDTVCIKLSLKDAKYLEPWSLAKHLKFGDGYYDVNPEDEIVEIRNVISSNFAEEDISDIYSKLMNPSTDVISELVSIPDRLKRVTK
jgi:agmatine deiminase